MRLFHLERIEDVSGISGLGFVAEGVEFDDQICVLHWVVGDEHSTTVFSNVANMMKIHSHEGRTKIVWVKE